MLKYEEIVSYIEEHIEDQTFKPNMKLPSLREMAEHFSTSVGTVLSAYKYLEQRHKIYSIPKSGYYIVGITDSRGYKKNSMIDFYSGAPDSRYIPFHDFQHCIDTVSYTHLTLPTIA